MTNISIKLLTLVSLVFGFLPSAEAADPTVVALFGDSTSQGFNTNFQERGFAMARLNHGQPSVQLTKLLNESNRPSVVPNLGWGGTSSGPAVFTGLQGNVNGVDRINSHLSDLRRDVPGKAYYALIMYGTNDFAFGIPASTTGFNNGLMIRSANANGYTALVSSIPPCDLCANNVVNINSSISREVQRQIDSGADAHFVDNHSVLRGGWNTALSDPDGVHPTDEGYKVIAQKWFDDKLEQLIKPELMHTLSPVISLLLDE